MWVMNNQLRHTEKTRESDILFYITGMKPTDELTQFAMIDYKTQSDPTEVENAIFQIKLIDLIKKHAKTE